MLSKVENEKRLKKEINYYTSYAKACLINGTTNRRSFDSCFEQSNYISTQVVWNIMRFATSTPPKVLWGDFPNGVISNRKEHRAIKKYQNWQKLVAALKNEGSWDSWLAKYNNTQPTQE